MKNTWFKNNGVANSSHISLEGKIVATASVIANVYAHMCGCMSCRKVITLLFQIDKI